MSAPQTMTRGSVLVALTAIFAVLAAGSERTAAQVPIHEYRFNGNGNDSAGNAHGVVGSEVSFSSAGVPGTLGQAAVFGTAYPYDDNDAIFVDNAYFTGFGTGDFTIATWIRRTNPNGRGDIVDANGVAGDGPGFQLQITGGDLIRLRFDDINGFVRPDSVGAINDTEWHHIVITVDRDSVTGFKYYIDGAFDSQYDPTSVSGDVNPHDDLRFGSINMTGSFAGEIALFQAFDEALSADQVARLYCGGGDDCDGDGISDACELQDVTITFDGQPLGALAPFSLLGYDISPFSGTPDIITVGNPAPGLGDVNRFQTSTTSITATGGDLFEFVQADYALFYKTVLFEGYVDGQLTQSQSPPNGTGTLVSTFTASIDELRVTISPELVSDAWADNIVLKRADDCDHNGVPDSCDPDCDGNGVADGCQADADGDTVPDVCDRCAAGDDTIDSDGDGIPDACDVCPGGDDGHDADGDGLADACDPCAGGRGSGDADGDGDLEWDDFARMAPCMEGPEGTSDAGCECFDTNGDGDVDLDDARNIQARFAPARGCYIEGRYYLPGQRNEYPLNCEICRPNRSITSWSLVASGQVCNLGSGDQCDPTEVCSGTSGRCPDDVVRPATTRCRPGSGDACDPDEFCTGVHGEVCPPNRIAARTTLCGAANGVCDVDDYCSGVAGMSCHDAVRPSTTVCRASAGACDVAESCTGAGADCPNDAVRPSTTECRASAGVCDVAEYCNGTSKTCPANAFKPAQTLCRSPGLTILPDGSILIDGDGLCDVAEYCTGTNPNCPADQFKAQGEICRTAVGVCDAVELCSGSYKHCPFDAKKAPTVRCGDNSGTCLSDVFCSGSSNDCPTVSDPRPIGASCDHVDCRNAGVCASGGQCVCPGIHVCRASTAWCDPFVACGNLCDAEEYYRSDGTCPPDGVRGTDYVCRRPVSLTGVDSDVVCDPPEFCDGVSMDCPPNVALNPGDVCRSGGECDAPYVCSGICSNTGGPFARRCTSNADCDPGALCVRPVALPFLCEPTDNGAPDGTSCDGGSGECLGGECTSLISGEGGVCDGHDVYFRGDPAGFHCDRNANVDQYLKCCTGGGIARAGQMGTCRQCCGNSGEDNGGCPQNNALTIRCCGSRCVDLETNRENCGWCGYDCNKDAAINQCTRQGTGECDLGECRFETVCNQGEYCMDGGGGCLLIPPDEDVRGYGNNVGELGALCYTDADCVRDCVRVCDTDSYGGLLFCVGEYRCN